MADINFSIPVCLSKAIQDWWEKREIFDSREQLAWRTIGGSRAIKMLAFSRECRRACNRFGIWRRRGIALERLSEPSHPLQGSKRSKRPVLA